MNTPDLGRRYAVIQTATGETHYHLQGPVDGEVVVMVPGATLPLGVWESLALPLVHAGYRVLRYDLPGRGHSPLGKSGAGFRAHLEQLHGLLDALNLRRPVRLVGLASGALVAAAYALQNPQAVSHVALMAPDGAATRFTLRERLLSAPGVGDLLFRLSARKTLMARVPRYSSRSDIQSFVRELLAFALRGGSDFRRGVLSTVRSFPLHQGAQHYRQLGQSGVPTCVVWGSEDQITPMESEVFREIFGSDQVHALAGVGHLPFVEAPEQVASLLRSHFQNPDSSTSSRA